MVFLLLRNYRNHKKTIERPKKKIRSSPLLGLFSAFLIISIWGAIFAVALIIWFGYDLPDLEEISALPRQPSVTMVDKSGNTLAVYGDWYGHAVDTKDLPPNVVNALLAVEDKRFYNHFGIDVIGLFRAFARNVEAGGVVQGGSTITQQLAKNFLQAKKIYGTYDRSIGRKISEAMLALMIEYKFTKEQILTMYLNRMYMGAGSYGIDAAALRYFGKHAEELNLYESAVLIGLLRAPSKYSPARNTDRSENRAKQVLKSMVECGFISSEAAAASMATPSPLDEGLQRGTVMYFTDWVFDTLSQYIDNSSGEDLEVTVTLDVNLQKIAEQQSKIIMERRAVHWWADQISLVSMRPDGAVLSMIGGASYAKSKFNRATQALRQPGSAFKFFVFLAAMERGYSAETLISDKKFAQGTWSPGNYMHKSSGVVSLGTGFAKSINAVSARLAAHVGIKRIIEVARRLGISTYIPENLTLSLGTGSAKNIEMTGAFSVIANNGYKVAPYGVLKIRNKSGKVLFQHKNDETQVVEPEAVLKMRNIMERVVATPNGTGRWAAIPGKLVYGKTGTSQQYRDFWFIGMIPELVTGVWCGRDNDRPMKKFQGGIPPAHLWKAYTERAILYFEGSDKWDEENNPTPEQNLEFIAPPPPPEENRKPGEAPNNPEPQSDSDDSDASDTPAEETPDDATDNEKTVIDDVIKNMQE